MCMCARVCMCACVYVHMCLHVYVSACTAYGTALAHLLSKTNKQEVFRLVHMQWLSSKADLDIRSMVEAVVHAVVQ